MLLQGGRTDKGRQVRTTAVGPFPANGWGLNDVIGNVWEWTATHWDKGVAEGCCGGQPHGPTRFVVKGGSFLCSDQYCARYRPAARQPQSADTATSHIGFRCAR
ncbi:formylglycine-generating enzyme family protein [Sphingomonas sp.]|uniref:formylglycine-generating enzyme family protein n=1 Tax=Sphingomonas sp. TaxID=28214 RepID=UPI0035C7FAB5